MKYIKLFDKLSDFESVKDTLDLPNVSLIQENNKVEYLAASGIDYSKEYLTFEALEDGLTAKLSVNACEYCVDNGDWTTLAANTETITINTGQTLSFRGNLIPVIDDITDTYGIGTFTISKKCNLKGNIMSLLYGNDFIDKTELTGKNYTFFGLFYNCVNIVDAYNLILPATILADHCYSSMFSGCTSLTKAPYILPATTLATYCYTYMFDGCTSLTVTPELPATILADHCYSSMFSGCISLTKAPKLPATTLAFLCYNYMFSDCTSLTVAPELPATILVDSCYSNMFRDCTGLTTAPSILPATTLAIECYHSMFAGCTSLVHTPELPATTLDEHCYAYMFFECTSLTTAPELPATTLVNSCYSSMFKDCSNLSYIKALFTTAPSTSYTYNWVSGVSSTGTFVKNKNATWNVTGVYGIPSGWAVETI